jgi:hypothetical protein
MSDAFMDMSSLMDQRKLDTFLCKRPTILMMCLDSTLLMQLAVVFAPDMKAIKAGSSPSSVFHSGELSVE